MIVYLVAEQGFKGSLQAVAMDEEGREMGRSSLALDLTAGEAGYHTFRFQSRTDLERKSRVLIR